MKWETSNDQHSTPVQNEKLYEKILTCLSAYVCVLHIPVKKGKKKKKGNGTLIEKDESSRNDSKSYLSEET